MRYGKPGKGTSSKNRKVKNIGSLEWHCHICGAMGIGGKGGWQHHYIREHYREANAAGYRKRDDR